jgi:hypothetical protein
LLPIETAARLIWLVRPYVSSLWKSLRQSIHRNGNLDRSLPYSQFSKRLHHRADP